MPDTLTPDAYAELRRRAAEDPSGFFGEAAGRLDWMAPFTHVKDVSFDAADLHIRWFPDGVLNACSNCVDRWLPTRADETAIVFEGDEPGTGERISFRELHRRVCRMANVLKARGVRKGDRVTLYLPMTPDAAVAMLACARIGAVHSVVFGGFSPEALAGRIADCGSRLVITADEGVRGGKAVPLKANVDKALEGVEVDTVLVMRRTGADVPMTPGRDLAYAEASREVSDDCPPEPMGAEDPLFILYTSGSTGKPKGVLHTTGGYLFWAAWTHETVFRHAPGDLFWCTADVGWVTGHSYVVYGPLANGGATLMFEGVPTWPDASRSWKVIDAHRVNVFYTAPTAIRALMKEGDGPLEGADLSSLRLLGTVGEPINPEAWRWYHDRVGRGRLPIVDTWWQTETGGVLISPVPGAVPDPPPGSATLPLPGVQAQLVDGEHRVLEGEAQGELVIAESWPGQMRTVWGDHDRFVQTYFVQHPGKYTTGDGARRDVRGNIWITGRTDDVINVSGHRIGAAEVESALVAHPAVAEAAVVGVPHAMKGQGLYAFVTLKAAREGDEALRAELLDQVRREIGRFAAPEAVQWAPGLPKTRSGKIMRRILRKIAEGETGELGDTSTLADPGVVDELMRGRVDAGG